MIRILGTIFAGLFGLAFGSFLNVCLSRWPQGESIVQPRSHCGHCGRTLTWWENVPLVSWLALRGRCRTCRAWIGCRSPLVELAVGALWALSAWRFMPQALDPSLPGALVCYRLIVVLATLVLLWTLVALAVLDAENLWLPDWITLPGIALGFLFTLLKLSFAMKLAALTGLPLTAGLENEQFGIYGIALKSLLGILAAAGLILLIRWAYWLIRRREGIGLGDAKLMALLAAWLGLPCALLSFVLGVVMGALATVVLLAIPSARDKSANWGLNKLPLGTFLCIGGIVSALWGQPLLTAYLRWAGF
jgi:leader peptidase (prepilin peptidase)/N-methyltransferase